MPNPQNGSPSTDSGSNWNLEVGFGGRRKPKHPAINSWSWGQGPSKTLTTNDVNSEIRNEATYWQEASVPTTASTQL